MGNQVGVCRGEPPQISELFSIHQQPDQGFGKHHDRTPQDDGFRSYLQIWRFYSDNSDEVVIKNSPVRFAQFKKFESKDCYIALHVIKNSDSKSIISPRPTDSPRNSTHTPTLCDLLASSMEALTPRGTSCSFGTLSLEPFIQNTTEEFTHDLYVWNGKNSSSLAKAVALAKGFEIERVLTQDKQSGALYQHFSRTPKAALSSHFVDDLAGIKQDYSRLQFDNYKYENNHIYKQLLGTNRKPVSSVKIGELFGTPSDGPRYEVLKKLMHSQPNGLVATKTPDMPTKYPPIKVPISKIPLLNFSPKDSNTPPPKEGPFATPANSTPNPSYAPNVLLNSSMPPASVSKATHSKPNPTLVSSVSSSSNPSKTQAISSTNPTSLVLPSPPTIQKVPSLVLPSTEPRTLAVPRVPSLPNLPFSQASTPREQPPEDYSIMPHRELRAIFEPVLSRILGHLFLGGQKPAMNKAMLQEAGITHVLNCAGGACDNYFPNDFVYKTYDIGDGVSEDIACLFFESLEFIEEAVRSKGKVLIHCHQGISRSTAFVICYLMWKNNWDYEPAFNFIKELRYIASPNPGFITQLLLWRKTLDKDKKSFETSMFRIIRHSRNLLHVPKQVPTPSYAALDPRGCFIIQTPTVLYYWVGERCPSFYLEAAKRIISSMQKYESLQGATVVEVQQGQESEEFWQVSCLFASIA